MSYRRSMNGLGTCQWPQPGVEMVYPPCATDAGYQSSVRPTQAPIYTGITSVYDVPGLVLPPASSCVDEQGNAAADPGCVERNLAIQQENFKRYAAYNNDPTFRAQFADSAPVATNHYAQTGPAFPSGPIADIPIVKMAEGSPAAAPAASTTAGYVEAAQTPVKLGGFEFPAWGLVAAGVGALFLLGRR